MAAKVVVTVEEELDPIRLQLSMTTEPLVLIVAESSMKLLHRDTYLTARKSRKTCK